MENYGQTSAWDTTVNLQKSSQWQQEKTLPVLSTLRGTDGHSGCQDGAAPWTQSGALHSNNHVSSK